MAIENKEFSVLFIIKEHKIGLEKHFIYRHLYIVLKY